MKTRIEKDSMGTLQVPDNAYYGIYTQRVLGNFQISNQKVPLLFLQNYIKAKKIYAFVNAKNKKLDKQKAELIEKACNKLLASETVFMQYFPIDAIQSGGGTSTNMMVNEVIANIANEIVGVAKGTYSPIHPNDHVNMSQSSNDTFPGVIKLTAIMQFVPLLEQLTLVKKTIHKKSVEFLKIKKVGRTHLQDALSITFGNEFSAWERTIEKNILFLQQIRKLCLELPFGGTALGSLQNITPKIRKDIISALSKEFGFGFKKSKNYFEGTSSSSDLQKIANALDSLATDIIKIANDLRLLSSGPRAGFNEILLPAVQAGSSIMPGKVNPSILEALNMVCFKIKGLAATVDITTMHAQLQLQALMPMIGFSLYEMFDLFTNSLHMFWEKCLLEIQINKKETQKNLDYSFVYATEYSEILGYAKVAELVKKAYSEDLNLKELLDKELKIKQFLFS
ncbi:MAG TPA: lyase family protein [Patescibacteria group bacterium]